jgi:hypothetical protein
MSDPLYTSALMRTVLACVMGLARAVQQPVRFNGFEN